VLGGDFQLLGDSTVELDLRRTIMTLDVTNITGNGGFKVSGDFSFATNLYRGAANRLQTDDALFLGVDGTGVDLQLYTTEAGDNVLWDASDKQLEFIDCSITLNDSDKIIFGTGADAEIYHNGADLIIDPTQGTSTDGTAFTGHVSMGNVAGVITNSVMNVDEDFNSPSGNVKALGFNVGVTGDPGSVTIEGCTGTASIDAITANGTGVVIGVGAAVATIGAPAAPRTFATIKGFFSNNVSLSSNTTVTDAYGYFCGDNLIIQGTFTNVYGIFIEDVNSGGTNSYGLVIQGADTRVLWLGSGADNTDAANGITWGSSADTNLYRSAADTLKTDDAMIVGSNFTVGSGGAGIDYTLTFDGESDDCVLTYDEDNNILTFGDTAITTTGIGTFATASVIGNLTLGDGSIVDSSGAISFGNETLTTTGLVTSGASAALSLEVLGTTELNENVRIGSSTAPTVALDVTGQSIIDSDSTRLVEPLVREFAVSVPMIMLFDPERVDAPAPCPIITFLSAPFRIFAPADSPITTFSS